MNRIIARGLDTRNALTQALRVCDHEGATFLTEAETSTGAVLVTAPTAGYCVGGVSRAWVQAERPSSWDLWQFIRDREESTPAGLSANQLAVGFWRDSSTGKWWIDTSEVLSDRREAIQRGIARGERAIWDVQAGAEIRLDQPLPLGDILTREEAFA
jgi:hypothetical protein